MLDDFKLLFDRKIATAIELKLIAKGELKGFSSDEILLLENELNIELPSIYKYFLSICGDGGGQLLEQTYLEYHYCNLVNNRELVTGMIEEDTRTNYDPLPDRAFFFAQHIASHHWYFICDRDADPITYYITLGWSQPMKQRKLSESIIGNIESSIKFLQSRNK